ncbi:MAG: DUF2232 domain-containing protein [bacterium]
MAETMTITSKTMEEKQKGRKGDVVATAVIAALLYELGWTLSPWGIFLVGLSPLPICLATLARGRGHGLLVILLGLPVIYLFSQGGSESYFFFTLGLMGTVIGTSIRRGVTPKKTVLLATFILLFLFSLHFLFALIYAGEQPFALKWAETIRDTVKIQGTTLIQQLEYQEASPEEIEGLRLLYDRMITTAFHLAPALLLLISVFYAWLFYELIKLILKKGGYALPKWPTFSLWRVPDTFVWGFIVGWGGMLVGEYKGIELLYLTGLNLRYIFQFIYLLIGLSIVAFYLKKYKVSPFMQAPAYLLLILFTYPPTFLGVADTWFDFRKLEEKQERKELE